MLWKWHMPGKYHNGNCKQTFSKWGTLTNCPICAHRFEFWVLPNSFVVHLHHKQAVDHYYLWRWVPYIISLHWKVSHICLLILGVSKEFSWDFCLLWRRNMASSMKFHTAILQGGPSWKSQTLVFNSIQFWSILWRALTYQPMTVIYAALEGQVFKACSDHITKPNVLNLNIALGDVCCFRGSV